MHFNSSRFLKAALTGLTVLALVGCSLPRSGPSKSQLLSGSHERKGDAFVVPITMDVINKTKYTKKLSFGPEFTRAGQINTDVIRSGDQLLLTVYENVEAGVLGTAGVPSSISNLQVDNTGFIFVPYAGRIRASGSTIETVRRRIERNLAEQTPDPQVQLARSTGVGASVTIVGAQAQGVFQIDPASTHLSSMLAKAGGTKGEPATTIVSVTRGKKSGSIWLQDLLTDPSNDIHLRPGDRILLEADKRRYSVFGEIGTGNKNFSKPEMSLFDVIASNGGIKSASGDPRGVFVLRNEIPRIASYFYDVPDYVNSKRVMYVFNLVQPNGIFLADEFQIRDGDIIYVTEAPYSQYTKLIRTIITPINTLDGIANRF